jgi:hypothetical protein
MGEPAARLLSRRRMVLGLGASAIGLPLLDCLQGHPQSALAQAPPVRPPVLPPLLPVAAGIELSCSELARGGGHFVRSNIDDFIARRSSTLRLELVDRAGKRVYLYELVARAVGASGGMFSISAADNRGRTALLGIESAGPFLAQGRLVALESMNLRLEYAAPPIATAPAQRGAASVVVTARSDLRNVVPNSALVAQIVNAKLLGEMANALLLLNPVGGAPPVVSAPSCFSCRLLVGAFVLTVATSAAAIGVTALATTAAAALAGTATSLGAGATALKLLSEYAKECIGACK